MANLIPHKGTYWEAMDVKSRRSKTRIFVLSDPYSIEAQGCITGKKMVVDVLFNHGARRQVSLSRFYDCVRGEGYGQIIDHPEMDELTFIKTFTPDPGSNAERLWLKKIDEFGQDTSEGSLVLWRNKLKPIQVRQSHVVVHSGDAIPVGTVLSRHKNPLRVDSVRETLTYGHGTRSTYVVTVSGMYLGRRTTYGGPSYSTFEVEPKELKPTGIRLIGKQVMVELFPKRDGKTEQ